MQRMSVALYVNYDVFMYLDYLVILMTSFPLPSSHVVYLQALRFRAYKCFGVFIITCTGL